MTAATATFREQGHEYQVEGIPIPSVTQVLTLAGIDDVSKIPFHNLERARVIGTAVHEACQFLDEEDLLLASLDPEITGYVLAYQKFRLEHGFEPEKIECRKIAMLDGMKYGMCVDRVGTVDGMESIVLDIKTASRPSPAWAIQTAAYAAGLSSISDYRRMVVHLAKDGKYKLIAHNDEADLAVFHAALKVAHWRMNHGVKLR